MAKELNKLIKQLDILIKSNKVQRTVLNSMLGKTSERIFSDGKDANNAQIGNYSDSYMKTRQRNNWPNSRKVILQATTQMVDDFSVIIEGNSYGLGFKNKTNLDKSFWVEETYDKEIFSHTKNEENLIGQLWEDEVRKLLK